MDITLEVDKFGRVLLPKRLREALHIGPGGKLHAHLDGERLTVTPESREATVRMENGFPLIDLPSGAAFIGDPVAEARAERDRELLERLAETW
jgi:bifunctional DNA-binding transcriptional regulator/antitoxin component of YhaV-PrlF toxin-antitoxin module